MLIMTNFLNWPGLTWFYEFIIIFAYEKSSLLLIEREKKSECLQALKAYKKENSTDFIEEFFFHSAILRMEKEMDERQKST